MQDSYGHGSLGHASNCTRRYINEYVLNGWVPRKNMKCSPNEPLFSAPRLSKLQQAKSFYRKIKRVWVGIKNSFMVVKHIFMWPFVADQFF
jgi:translation initiation factor RLI1